MNNTEFVRSPQKAAMIVDGVEYIAWRLHKLSAEVKVLNQWMHQVPDMVQRGQLIRFDETLSQAYDAFRESSDLFVEQLALNQQERERLNTFYQNIDK